MGEAGDRGLDKDIVILMDEDSCGTHAVESLVALGEEVRTVRSVFGQSVKDADWLPVAGANDWVVVTRDKSMRYSKVARALIEKHSVKYFVVVAKNLTGHELASVIVTARHRIKHLATTTRGHLIAAIGRDGRVRIKVRGETRKKCP